MVLIEKTADLIRGRIKAPFAPSSRDKGSVMYNPDFMKEISTGRVRGLIFLKG
jgi:hypothetical protein